MKRRILFALLSSLVATEFLLAQPQGVPGLPLPSPYYSTSRDLENPELVQLRRGYLQLKNRIGSEQDEEERERLSKKLADHMEAMFDVDFEDRAKQIKRIEAELEKMKTAQGKRKTQRDRIIKSRIEQVLLEVEGLDFTQSNNIVVPNFANRVDLFDGPPRFNRVAAPVARAQPLQPSFEKTFDQVKDGERKVRVKAKLHRAEQRTREVPYTVNIPQRKTRIVQGKVQKYTVNVPETRMRTETYSVMVPFQEELTFTVPEGADWKQQANKELAKQQEKKKPKKK